MPVTNRRFTEMKRRFVKLFRRFIPAKRRSDKGISQDIVIFSVSDDMKI